MIGKCVVMLFLAQAFVLDWTTGRHVSLLHLRDSIPVRSPILDATMRASRRGRRSLTTTLSLLWPQVVGPVEQGVITERDYNDVPKTILEYRLDMLRRKAAEEEQKRLAVREFMKRLTKAQDEFYGYQNNLYVPG